MADEYTDILIHIRPWDEEAQAYPVEATLDDGDFFSGGELRLDEQALLAAQLEPETYGLELFYALLSGPIRRAYDKATGRAEARTEGRLRVRLWIDAAAAELHAHPWERIYHVHKGQPVPLATSTLTPFSRYVALPLPEPDPITTRPIRLLIAISNPSRLEEDLGLTPLDVAEEVENLHLALGDLRRGGHVQVTLLPGRSGLPSTLQAQLENEGYRIQDGITGLDNILRLLPGQHVLHFVGHGFFEGREGPSKGAALYLEREDGRWEAVRDKELTTRLATTDPLPHLVFLSACESGKSDVPSISNSASLPSISNSASLPSISNSASLAHPFVGLAPGLVKAGIPAVVAMQDKVPIDVGRELTGDFYRRLLEHGTVDRALNESRSLLFEQGETDWAIPVLFMRLGKGQLFTADPARLVLQAIQAHEAFHPWAENEYLPIEVVHLVGDQDPGSLAQIRRDPVPSLDVVEAALGLFSMAAVAHREHTPQATEGPGQASTRAPGKSRDERLFVALVGDHGMAKSTQLRRLAWLTADRSLQPDARRQVIPVYVDLVDLERNPPPRSIRTNPIESLILEGLRPFWPDLTAERLSDLLEADEGPTLRILLDGSDDLPDTERHKAWRKVKDLAREYPRHEYMLAVDPDYFDPSRLDVTDLLVIQPLSQRKIEQFLKSLDSPIGRRLYGALSRAQLFDLAASPWLLIRMLNQAREGIFPRSRTEVLRKLVEDAIVEVPSRHGMRSRADRTLYALGWDMQSARSSTWPVSDAFHTMAAIRGNREYSLEGLYDALAKQDLLARVGEETMRFAYPAIQAYCCARAILHMEKRDQVLDDVTATLGRLTRLRWWEDTLILLSGLMEDPGPLIRMILYGAALAEGEQAFLAARCLLESESQEISPDLVNQVVDALVWRLDSNNERSIARRIRAAQALGQLGQSGWLSPSAGVPHLARAANQKVRLNWREEMAYEYSSVRMASAVALQRLGPAALEHIDAIDSQLAEVMALWKAKDVEGLGDILRAEETGAQAIAAFALGELQTERAVDLLVATFLDPDVQSETRWAATDALALLDPAVVTRRAILPLLDEEIAEREGIDRRTWNRRNHWYERMAYLVGNIRAQHPEIRAFLDRCLYEFTGVWLKAKAIRALGSMYARGYKGLFEKIAVGDFSGVALREHMPEDEAVYLRRKAIQALAHIGDRDTLAHLRANRTEWCPELERAFYWTSEEIRWRISLGDSQPTDGGVRGGDRGQGDKGRGSR